MSLGHKIPSQYDSVTAMHIKHNYYHILASKTYVLRQAFFPSSMAQLPSHSVPNKSQKLPFIPSQNKQDALSKLQLSWKDHTNGPPPYAGMQLMVKRPPIGSQISPPTSGSAVPHKHRQHHKLPQTYLPSASRRCPRKLNPATLLKYRPNIDLYS